MIPFSRPYYNHQELLALLRPGAGREQFETAVATLAGVKYGLAFTYGRMGLVAAFRALGIHDAEIVLPAYTCLVMAHAVMASGNRPRFVDIDLADYNMDLTALKRALTPQTRAVVATHLYGYPTNVEAIRAAVGDERIIIVEDCALGLHVLTSESAGLHGDLGLFSFGAGKPLSIFEGGILIARSSDLYEKIKTYRDKEMSCFYFRPAVKRWVRLLASQLVFQKPIYDILYRPKSAEELLLKFNLPPDYLPADNKMTLPEYQARVGLVQLGKLKLIIARRRTLAGVYDQTLKDCPGIYLTPHVEGATFAYYTLRVSERDENDFERRMIGRGVAVDRTYNYALPYLKPYRRFAQGEYPQAVQAAREVVNLPCYPHLQKVQAKYVADCVRQYAYETYAQA